MSGLTTATVSREPDFRVLLDSLAIAVNENYRLSQEILGFSNSLKPLKEMVKKDAEPIVPLSGIVDHLWEQVHKLQKINLEFLHASAHLNEVVGG